MRYLSKDLSLQFDSTLCIGCGLCAEVCPHGVFSISERKAQLTNREACIECGACSMNCPVQAIHVNRGVGCAEAIINGMLTGKETCCGQEGECCCSGNEMKNGKSGFQRIRKAANKTH